MKYEYNGDLLFEERVYEIYSQIVKKYPEMDKETVLKAAALETPITDNNIIDAKYKRYSNILSLIDENKMLKNEVINDILEDYKKEEATTKKLDTFISNLLTNIKYGIELPIYK